MEILLYEQFINEYYGSSPTLNRQGKFNLKTEYGKTIYDFMDSNFFSSRDPQTSTIKSYLYDAIHREVINTMNGVDMDDWSQDDWDNWLIQLIDLAEDEEGTIVNKVLEVVQDDLKREVIDDLEWDLRDAERNLKDYVRARAELDKEQDLAAGQKIAQGKEWTDDDANEFGEMMIDADSDIEKAEEEVNIIKKKIEAAEKRVADPKFVKHITKLTKKEIDLFRKAINKL